MGRKAQSLGPHVVTDRISLGRAYALSAYLTREVRRAGVPLDKLLPVGGLRRFAPWFCWRSAPYF